ncbi:capsule assembly Wzi family protein [Flavihumibacter sp. R14]|nr:capsule assembly Wzi family protein [Flavihumibacter soli]
MNFIKAAFLVLAVIKVNFAFGQSLPVGTPVLEDHFRRAQLSSKIDSNISFTIRPLSFGANFPAQDESSSDSGHVSDQLYRSSSIMSWGRGKGKIVLLPADLKLRLNTHHPYGWNDGPMIPAKGLQTMFSAGIYAKYGPLSIQLKPEVVMAANNEFQGFSKDHFPVIWARYYDFYNFTDLPERFGTETYNKAFWGQSSIRLNFDPVSIGVSTENLWWGPGKRNSLLMSNTATGFKHLSLNTTRPVRTPAGSIEAQLIAGRLEGSGFDPLTPGLDYMGSHLTLSKPDDWRYLSGFAFSWNPKWVPGLFLGLTRSFQTYHENMGNRPGDYLPLFSSYRKAQADEGGNLRDEYSSLFFRWVWFDEQAELYFEYGSNNHSSTMRNNILKPENARAYLFGVTKLFDFRARKDEKVEVSLELAQLQQSDGSTVLNADSWYLSKNIPHGLTNRGELLGAGVGPGGSLQTFDVSWIKGFQRLGLQFERFAHNEDFYVYAYNDSEDFRRHWVDLSMAVTAEQRYKEFLFHASFKALKSLNYQWYLLQQPDDPYFVNGRDKFNISIDLGFSYRF